MALQFQPPPDWLIQQYMTRKRPGELASEGIGAALEGYASAKNQEEQKASLDAQRKAAEFKAIADYVPEDQIPGVAKQYGINIPSAGSTPPVVSTGTAVTPNEMAGQQSLPSEHPAGVPDVSQPPSLIDRWNQTMGGKPTSKAGLAKYKTGLETKKLEQDLAKPGKGPLIPKTHAQLLAQGSYDQTKEVAMEPAAPRLDVGTKQDQFDQKEWDKIVKDVSPQTASTRTGLGMATKANFQADRALVTLSKPVVTVQEAGNVMADIAAIYQMGSPTQYGMSHQEYSTLYGKVQGALQSVTGKPQDALPDAVKERLVGVLHDMKSTNAEVLKQHLDFTEKSKAKIIKKFPDEWRDIRSTLEGNPNQPGQTSIPGTGPHGASVSQNGHTYNWNSRTGQYE